MPYFGPYSFRKTFVELGLRVCRTPEQMKAWSQNLGHEKVMTTLTSYGNVPASRQSEIMRQLCRPNTSSDEFDKLVRRVAREIDTRAELADQGPLQDPAAIGESRPSGGGQIARGK